MAHPLIVLDGAIVAVSEGCDRAHRRAETGVDFIAVGALTHPAPALDVALDW